MEAMMNISQSVRIDNLEIFAKLDGHPLTEMQKNGMCNGDSFLWALAKKNKQNEKYKYKEDCEFIASLTPTIMKNCIEGHNRYTTESALSRKQGGTEEEIEQRIPEMFRIEHQVYSRILAIQDNLLNFQNPEFADANLAQTDIAAVANIATGAIVHGTGEEKIIDDDKLLEEQFSFSFVFDTDELAETLKSCMQQDKIYMITSVNHATAMLFDGTHYYYFDPNYKDGEKEFKDINALSKAIHDAMTFEDVRIEGQRQPQENQIRRALSIRAIDYVKNKNEKFPSNSELISTLVEKRSEEKPINVVDVTGQTALMLGVQTKNITLVQDLLKLGADANTHDKDGKTALLVALLVGDLSIASLLLEKGADPNKGIILNPQNLEILSKEYKAQLVQQNIPLPDDTELQSLVQRVASVPPLLVALGKKNFALVKLLLDKGADIKYISNDQLIPLLMDSNKEIVELFFQKFPDLVNWSDPSGGANMYHYAAALRAPNSILDLLDKKLINVPDGLGMTPLHIACKLNYTGKKGVGILKYLLANGADMNAKDKKGKTALMIAEESKNLDFVAFLNNQSSPVAAVEKRASPILPCIPHIASSTVSRADSPSPPIPSIGSEGESVKIPAAAVTKKARRETVHIPKETQALISALKTNDKAQIQELIEKRHVHRFASYEAQQDSSENNLLFVAMRAQNEYVLRALKDLGWPMNIFNVDGNNLLHAAIIEGKKDIIPTLLELGVDPYNEQQINKGNKAYSLAEYVIKKGWEECEKKCSNPFLIEDAQKRAACVESNKKILAEFNIKEIEQKAILEVLKQNNVMSPDEEHSKYIHNILHNK